jgi:hypothetical protein
MYIETYSKQIDWHELMDEKVVNFVKEFADKYKILEMDQSEFVEYYHKNPKKFKRKRNTNFLWLFNLLLILFSLPTLVVLI